jgi:hypothetical protein
VSFFNEVSTHKLLSLRALLVAWFTKMIWLSPYLYVYGRPSGGVPAMQMFSHGMAPSSYTFLIGIFAMMSSGWIIAQTHRAHYRAMVLLYIVVELVGALLTFITGSAVFGFYYWTFPLTQTLYAFFSHFGIFNFIGTLWASIGITVVSILIGAGFFRRDRGDASQELNSASA